MNLVVGLGNPGSEYASTKHNLGFLAVDEIGKRAGIDLTRKKFHGLYGEGIFRRDKLILLKPETYMNRSGESVSSAVSFYHIPPENIIIVHDELDLPAGTVRIKPGGGSAGHKGVASIIERLGNGDFIRIRIGIGKPKQKSGTVSHVLSKFSKEENEIVNESVLKAADAVLEVIEHGLRKAMNKYNVRAESADTESQE
ncbi:MAG TPA: aminoacyl-tRNA hydrolase [Thermodesulfobacteriota bacterium]|nr:aminoacyl-tRNA hydrolase [Thermodesulfobacteriota bacterium]